MRNLRAGCVATLLFMLAAAWPSNAMATQVNASVVIRVEHVGGFVGPNFASARLPDVVLYSDGSVLAPNNQDGSVRHMFVRTISKAVLQSELSAFTQVTKTPTGGWGIPSVSDLPSTEVSITQNGKVSVVDVYALGFALNNSFPEANAARKKLSQAISKLVALAGHTTSFNPTRYEVWPSAPISLGTGSGADSANPAALFCLSQGGSLVTGKVSLDSPTPPPDLSIEYCQLADGSFVDEWSYFYQQSKTGISWPIGVTPPNSVCLSVAAKPFVSLLRSAGSKQWLLPNGSMINLLWRPVLPGEIACHR